MKKLLAVFLVLLLCSTVLFGQGARDRVEEEVITLSLFHYLDLTDPVSSANWEELLDTFSEQNPDIRFDIEYGFDEAYHNKLQVLTVANQLPDIMFLWPCKRTGEVTGSGQIKDLRPWLEGKEDLFSPMAMTPQGPDGEIYELPEQVTATHVMFANEKLMDELGLSFPATLEELLDQGDVIRDAGLIPIAMTNRGGWQMQSCLLSALVERTGGMDWFDRAISGEAKFTDPMFVDALRVIDTLSREQMFSPGINTLDYGEALTSFVTERAVYYIDGGWRVNNMVGELSEAQKEYVSLNVFPEVPNTRGQQGSTAAVAGTGHGMNSRLTEEEAEAAWKWIWFYSGPEGSGIRQEHGALPAYNLPPAPGIDSMTEKLMHFVGDIPAGYVIDAVMDAAGMDILHAGLQEMIMGRKTPRQVASEYEAWVSAHDSGRQQ